MMRKRNKKQDRLIDMPAADPTLASPLNDAQSAEFVPSLDTEELGTAQTNADRYYDVIPDLKSDRFI